MEWLSKFLGTFSDLFLGLVLEKASVGEQFDNSHVQSVSAKIAIILKFQISAQGQSQSVFDIDLYQNLLQEGPQPMNTMSSFSELTCTRSS